MNAKPLLKKSSSALGEDGFLQVQSVSKQFGSATVVSDLNLSIRRNEFFALLGSSGCGKSTLLRIMAGLETPTQGRIVLDGQDISDMPAHERPVNMMFQSYALFPHMNVTANIAYGLKREGRPKAEINERVAEVLELVQMHSHARHMPAQLSGGQQQRVALARSLVKQPKLLLLDEPMSALDKQIRQKTQFELGNILYKVGVTCVMVTHDQEEAMTMADRLAVMSEGRIVQIGSPEQVYETPATQFAAEFIGSTNVFAGVLADRRGQMVCADLAGPLDLGEVAQDAQIGQAVRVSVRPERIRMQLASPQTKPPPVNAALGTVAEIGYMGSYTLFYVTLASSRTLMVNVPREVMMGFERAPDYDDTVLLQWSSRSLVRLA
jgi:putrescine transport system ATP-binding protein